MVELKRTLGVRSFADIQVYGATVTYSNEIIEEGGSSYVVYTASRVFSYSVDADNKTRTATVTITADKANYAENEISHLTFNSPDHPSKWSFDPPIPKTNRHIVKMSFVTKVERL